MPTIAPRNLQSPPIVRRCIATIAALLALVVTQPTWAEEETWGLQLYSLRHQMEKDVPGALAQVSAWGLPVVEGGGNLYGQTVDGFRELLQENNLSLASVDTTFEELRDNPIAAVYKARFFGAKFATFYWVPHDGEAGFTLADAEKTIAVMNTAGKLLADNDIVLQYHLHGYEFLPYGEGTLFDYIASKVTEAKFQMDVFWVRQGGVDPTALLQKYPGKFVSLHLKDREHGTPDSSDGRADDDSNVVLGSGDVGIADVVNEARRQGIRYFFIEDESSHVLRQVPQSIEYLETL